MSRYQFTPPPRITQMSDLDTVAKKPGIDWRALRACAVHECAHAVAAIIFKRPHVVTIIRADGAGKTWTHDGYDSNFGSLYEDAVISWCGVAAEQVLNGASNDVLDDEVHSDHANAIHESAEYVAKFMELPPPWMQDWLRARTPKQLAALARKAVDKICTDSRRDSRSLVCTYWPLIEEMAYVALRDSGDGVYSWTGQPRALDWVNQRVTEIDSGKRLRKTAYPRPKWLRNIGGERRNRDLLQTSRGLSDRISTHSANGTGP